MINGDIVIGNVMYLCALYYCIHQIQINYSKLLDSISNQVLSCNTNIKYQ